MYAADGVGLAANQIGVDARVFVYACPDAAGELARGYVVNPRLTMATALGGTAAQPEGCLSIPGPHAPLERPALAEVTGVNMVGVPVRVSGTGLLARCLQHEVDHLDGKLYVDRLRPSSSPGRSIGAWSSPGIVGSESQRRNAAAAAR